MKELMAIGASILIIIAYAPYIKNILTGKTIPHAYSWFISALVTYIAFGVQLEEGAGLGIIPTFVGAVAGSVVFALSLRIQKRAPITKSDTFFFGVSLLATVLWLAVDQPLLSVILVSCIDILSFFPTYRKSWIRPDQETASTYVVNSLRFSMATISVQNYTIITVLYPLSQAIADSIFALFLILRRHCLSTPTS